MREHGTDAAAIGIDEAFIASLVETFYDRIRADEKLGPIFNTAIGDGWDVHLARMKDFWASVALHAGSYSGRPVQVHKSLNGVNPAHFEQWLHMFHETVEELAPSDTVVDFFMERAERIATSLKSAMFESSNAARKKTYERKEHV